MSDIFSEIAEADSAQARKPPRIGSKELVVDINTHEFGRKLGMPSEHYHALIQYESNSTLQPILRSHTHYEYEKMNKPMLEKKHFRIGTAIHTALLEPARFKNEYVVSKDFDARTSAGKAERDAFLKLHQGKFIITQDDMNAINGIAENITYHHDAMAFLKNSQSEVSYFWQDPDTSIWMRARLDCESPLVTLDVKSTDNASKEEFLKSCINYNYDMQAYIYSEARMTVAKEAKEFAFLAVEKKAPYEIALYVAPKEMLASGMIRYREALSKVVEYRQYQSKTLGYQPDGKFDELDWPGWASLRK